MKTPCTHAPRRLVLDPYQQFSGMQLSKRTCLSGHYSCGKQGWLKNDCVQGFPMRKRCYFQDIKTKGVQDIRFSFMSSIHRAWLQSQKPQGLSSDLNSFGNAESRESRNEPLSWLHSGPTMQRSSFLALSNSKGKF